MGGLGNQLFQIFATISYALQNKTSFCFPYYLSESETKRYTYWNDFLSRLLPFTSLQSENSIVIKENDFHYVPLPDMNTNDNIQIHGYFQSPLYFEKFWNDIIDIIQYKDVSHKVQEKYKEMYSLEDANNTISMHFRLGDYKKYPWAHPILSKEYYEKSLKYIIDNSKEETHIVYYFCEAEDIADVLSSIQYLQSIYGENIQFIKVDDTISDWEQMVLMSLCRHHITANSSFSWWGAYFSRVFYPNSITCCPKNWFGHALQHYNTNDLYPKEWIRIE
jgi:hypothetical protein